MPAKPGVLDPKWERVLHKTIVQGKLEQLSAVAEKYPESQAIVAVLEGLLAAEAEDHGRALRLCRWAWHTSGAVEEHPFVRKYISGSHASVQVANGVAVTLPISREVLGLALAELEQAAGNVDAAIQVVEQLEPTTIAAVSLAELYTQARRYDAAIDLTNGIANLDDPTALLLVYRGIALRETGHTVAAREAFKQALKSRSREPGIRHFALVERARTYLAEGSRAMARKDLERVLAENAAYQGVREFLAEL